MSSTDTAAAAAADAARRPPAAAGGPGRPARRPPKPPPAPASDAEIRKFGVVMLVGFGLIGGILFWRGLASPAYALLALGAAVGGLALVAPGPARPVQRAWMAVAHVLGRVNTTILLTLFYALMIVPIGLVFRLIGRDALHRRKRADAGTYWEPKRLRTEPRSYFDQF